MWEYLEWLALALIPLFMALELLAPARRFARTPLWRINGLAVTGLALFVSFEVTAFWDRVFAGVHLFDGAALGPWLGAGLGILVYELGHYAYHRTVHTYHVLWRAFHQTHHVAESLDAFGAYFLHPLDAAAFTSVAALILFPLLGLSLEAALLVNCWLVFNAMFQHANIVTPHWLGYLIQRPESHAVHHGRGIHAYNYADLPVVDMLFGTFRNPRPDQVPSAVGFYEGASNRWFELAVGVDVSEPPPTNPTGTRSYGT